MAIDELDAMLVRNLAQARLAYDRIEYAIEPAVQRELELTVRQEASRLGWQGGFDWDKELWLAPPEWVAEEVGDVEPSCLAKATFESDGQEGEGAGSDGFWLVTMCQLGRGRHGIALRWEKALGTSKAKWRKVAGGHRAIDGLVRLGYAYEEDGHFFRPVPFGAEALATAIETRDWEPFMAPLVAVMKELPKAAALFGEIMEDVRLAQAGG